MKKFLLILFAFLAFSLSVSAEDGYDMLYPFENGFARAVQELKWGLLGENQEVVLPFEWDFLGEVSEGFRLAKKGNLYGFLDEAHKSAIAPAYHQAGNFSENLACVKNEEGLWGYIDTEGNLVIPYMYEDANDFSCGLALIKTGGLYGYIDKENQPVIPAVYEEAYPFYEDRACVLSEGKYGYIDPTGALVIPAEFELAFDFYEGGAVVKQGGYGLIDSAGNFLISPDWDHLSPQLKNGLLKAEKNGKYAFIDSAGVMKTEAVYSYLGDFSEGLACVQTETGYGYLDSGFQIAIPAEWDSAGSFFEGFAVASKEGAFGYIDKEGKPASEMIYTECSRVSGGVGAVCEDGRWHFMTPGQIATGEEPRIPEIKPISPAARPENENTLILRIGHNEMSQGEKTISLDVAPILFEGYTMLPIRQVAEAIGGQVGWEDKEKKITVSYGSHSLVMYANQTAAYVDGRVELLEKPPMILDDRTLVPLRFATESLGCQVEWEPETQEIVITY